MSEFNNNRGFNIFWPALLIGVGVILLLANFGVIAPVNLVVLFRLWPLVLVALGIKIMFGREYPWLSNLISIILVIAAIAFLFLAPSLGFKARTAEIVTENFKETIGGASSAIVSIDIDQGELTIKPSSGSNNLIEVETTHDGEAALTSTGSDPKTISYRFNEINSFTNIFDFEGLINSLKVTTDIDLTTKIPFTLDVDMGSGSAVLQLSEMDITRLKADTGSGKLTVMLPGNDFPADLGAGSGILDITAAPGSTVKLDAGVGSGRIFLALAKGMDGTLNVGSGSGTIKITVPVGLGVELSGTTGSGTVSVPSNFIRTQGSDTVGASKSGTWQSPGFDNADHQVYIKFSVGSGTINLDIQ